MTRLAIVGAALTVGATAVIAALVGANDESAAATDALRRALGVVLFTAPAVIGLVGASRREATLLVAAGVLCLLQSVVAFSGVTLLYLPAALAFLLASAADTEAPPPPTAWHPARVALAIAICIPLAMVIVHFTGIHGVLAVVAAGGTARLLARSARSGLPVTAGSAVLGIVVVVLVFAGWIAASASTRQVCWVERVQAGGIVREELPSDEGSAVELGGDRVATGCDSGIPTADGAIATLGLVGAAVAAAVFAPLHAARPERRDGPSAGSGRRDRFMGGHREASPGA